MRIKRNDEAQIVNIVNYNAIMINPVAFLACFVNYIFLQLSLKFGVYKLQHIQSDHFLRNDIFELNINGSKPCR